MKTTRTLAIAAFVVVVAVTPLRSVLAGGVHEAWLPPSWPESIWGPVRVVVEDHTGVVLSINTANQRPMESSAGDRLLVVSWLGGCYDQAITLSLRVVDGGYRIDMRTLSNGCSFMNGVGRRVTMVTRVPIDPASVTFDAPEVSVR